MIRGHYDPLAKQIDRRGILRLMGGTTALAIGMRRRGQMGADGGCSGGDP